MTFNRLSLSYGVLAIFCWGSLAVLGKMLNHLPPFYVLGVCFLLGSLPALLHPKSVFTNWKVTIWGVLGYFLYHFFLFYSFRFAPAIEANLINYLWPMLLVLLTPLFFPTSKLRYYHLFGALLSFAGCVVLVSGKGLEPRLEYMKGYLLALGAAFTWPIYSIGKKKLGETTVWAVGGFCLGAGLLSLLTHAFTEPRVVLQGRDAWIMIVMGLGPMGVAFYAWDQALQKGDSRIVGALSYLTPVLSTLGLVVFRGELLTETTILAMVLIIGGASSGVFDIFQSNSLKKDR